MTYKGMPPIEDTVRRFLERYGEALSAGDIPTVVDCWDVPALVIADDGARSVATLAEIEQFFGSAVEWYRSQGQMATKPELKHVEPLGKRLVFVDVVWPGLDASGNVKSSEHSCYVLRFSDDGSPRIQVAISASS